MAKVISKIRAYSPNKKDTPTGNVKHLYYIATRTNAVLNMAVVYSVIMIIIN